MAETVGTKTEQKTSAGKDVYKTPEGESVSEKSVTIKFGDKAYVNAPSIHEGKKYTEDEIKKMLLEGVIKPTSRHDTLEEAIKAAETRSNNLLKDGGMTLAKQMEMFQDGGLMDEGGTVDPVSGNDVPPGSNQEEVRDDIPAQLSEGEFVFPADVVRYFGLEKLMQMRQEAKMGLQRMEDMGQMGNSEEAIMPDNLPFSIEDLDMEEDAEYNTSQEFAIGGMPNANSGVFYNPASQPTTGVATAPVQAASSNIARSIPIAQAATPMQAGSSNQSAMFNNYQLPQVGVPVMPQRDDLPPFLGGVVPGVGGGVDYVDEVYVNEAGATETFRRYTDGKLLDKNGNEAVIPEGYTIKSEADKKVTIDPTKVKTATVQDEGGSNEDNEAPGPSTTDVTGIGYNKSNLAPEIANLVSKYGAGFGTLADTFVKGPANAMAGLPGLTSMLGGKTTALSNSLTSAAFGGVLDNFRGYTGQGNLFSKETTAGGIMNTSVYTNNVALDQLGSVAIDKLDTTARAVVEELRGLFVDVDGNPISEPQSRQNIVAEAKRNGIRTTLKNTNIGRKTTAIIRELAAKKSRDIELKTSKEAAQQKTEAEAKLGSMFQDYSDYVDSYDDSGDGLDAGGFESDVGGDTADTSTGADTAGTDPDADGGDMN